MSRVRTSGCQPPSAHYLYISDKLGFVPLSETGAKLPFELIFPRQERGATLISGNLPSEAWTWTFGTERLTGTLPDRRTHHVRIIEMNVGCRAKIRWSADCDAHCGPPLVRGFRRT